MSNDVIENKVECNESKEISLETIAKILPKGIRLRGLWEYSFVDTIIANIDINEKVILYIVKNDNRIEYYSVQVMQEKFDLKTLYDKLLRKFYNNLSEEEKIFIYRYARIKEGIED